MVKWPPWGHRQHWQGWKLNQSTLAPKYILFLTTKNDLEKKDLGLVLGDSSI